MTTDFSDLTTVVHARAAELGDKPAICFLSGGSEVRGSLSYRELARRTRALAGALAKSFPPGTRVLIALPSGLDFACAFLACCEAQLIAVPVFPAATRRPRFVDRLHGIASDARPGLLLCAPAAREVSEALCAELAQPCRVACVEELEELGELECEPPPAHRLGGPRGAVVFLQYTSGSTRAPKGVVIEFANLLANLRAMQQHYGWTAADRMLTWLPLFHDMGLIGGMLLPLYCGMTVYLMPTESFVRSPRRWLDAISRHRATLTPAPDFAYALCAATLDESVVRELDLSSLRSAISGGEPVQPRTLRAFARKFAAAGLDPGALAPSYGQAEATLCVSARVPGTGAATVRLDRAAASVRRVVVHEGGAAPRPGSSIELVRCGRLVPGLEAAIVDPSSRRRCTPDRIGELWLRGSSVAAGYFGHRGASDATFAARLDAEEAESAGWLRTGDLAFFHEGELVICGRLKDTMIVGGRNVYPHDLELAAALAGGLRPGRIVAVSHYDAALNREAIWLIAEAESRRLDDARQLFAAVQEAALEACEVALDRIVLVRAGSIPLTTSGKLSRAATRSALEAGELPIVADSARELGNTDAAPIEASEDACVACFARLLARLRPGCAFRPEHTLTELGLDSLALVALKAALAELGYGARLADLFGGKTVRQLADDWAAQLRAGATRPRPAPPPTAAAGPGPEPLSFAQQRLWFRYELAPHGCDHNLVVRLHLRGPLDRQALQAALDWLVERHAILRTRYRTLPGGPEALSDPPAPVPLGFVDLELEGSRAEAVLRRAIEAEQATPFALRHDPALQPAAALRARLYRCSDELHHLLLSLHHIACDGRSAELLVRDLERAYRAARRRQHLPDPTGPQYAAFGRAERAAHDPAAEARALAFFRDHLAGLSTLELPRSRGAAGGDGRMCFAMPSGPMEDVARLARAERATPFLVLLTAFGVVVRHLTGAERFAVGTDVAGRYEPEAAGVVGFFVNQLALRCDVSGETTFRGALARVRADALGAYEHEQLAFDRLVAARSGEEGAPFQLKLNYQPAILSRLELDDLSIAIDVHQARGEFPLALDLVMGADGELRAALEYDAGLSARFVTQLGRLWCRLVAELGTHLERSLPSLLDRLAAWELEDTEREAREARDRLGRSRRRAIAAVEEI